MSNTVMLTVPIPQELYINMQKVSSSFKSDLNDDLVHLMECYVDSYQKLLRDPSAKILLGVK